MQSLVCSLSLLFAAPVLAQVQNYTVELRGEEEVPPVSTTGIGTATLSLDPSNGAVTVRGSYRNMSAAVAAAHIHGSVRRGRNGPVLLGLQVSGGTSGTISGQGTLTPQQVQDLVAGLTYFNVHTSNNPGGEIRGQVDVVPGTGTAPDAPPMSIDGAATAGGTLNLSCPPGFGSFFIAIGVPAAGVPLPTPIACSAPTLLALDPALIVVITGPTASLAIPASVGTATIAFQCGQIDINQNCVTMSAGHHVRFTP